MQQLHGLVVCGGLSSRMGIDKSMIFYHKKPQWQHVFDMLTEVCERVSISCNESQLAHFPVGYPTLIDDPEFLQIGPMGALLTAMKQHPSDSFLVVGCDYPLVTSMDLQQLTSARKPGLEAVCFYHSKDKTEEPILAIYEPVIQSRLKEFFSNSNFSLRQVLQKATIHRVTPWDESMLIGADTPADVQQIRMTLLASDKIKSAQ